MRGKTRTDRCDRIRQNALMRKATETTLHLAMLQCIPVTPSSKSTSRIREELRDINPDYDVTSRSVQRGLERLSSLFPITSEMRGRTNFWWWADKHALTQIPSMSTHTAFALMLAADYLKPIMPPVALALLQPYIQHAREVISGTTLGRWSDKVAIIGQGPLLLPPATPAEVQDAVYTALMESRQVEVDYRSKRRAESRRVVLNPLGIVVRDGVVYVVATSWHYEDVRQYVLHRMSEPVLLDEPGRALTGFRLDSYIRDEGGWSTTIKTFGRVASPYDVTEARQALNGRHADVIGQLSSPRGGTS